MRRTVKTFTGRDTRWGNGKTHLASGYKSVLEEPVAICGTIGTTGPATKGSLKEVTCKRCLRKEKT